MEHGADSGTRTHTPYGTGLSCLQVYQFHHIRMLVSSLGEYPHLAPINALTALPRPSGPNYSIRGGIEPPGQ